MNLRLLGRNQMDHLGRSMSSPELLAKCPSKHTYLANDPRQGWMAESLDLNSTSSRAYTLNSTFLGIHPQIAPSAIRIAEGVMQVRIQPCN